MNLAHIPCPFVFNAVSESTALKDVSICRKSIIEQGAVSGSLHHSLSGTHELPDSRMINTGSQK